MQKKIIVNRVDLGQRVTGYELMNVSANGKETVGYTPKQMLDAVKAGEVMGMVLNAAGELELDKAKGFNAIMVKTGIGTLTSTDPNAVANILYTVYERVDGDKFKVVSSRFGRLVYCADKVKALLDLGAINGVVLDSDGNLKCCWELEEEPKELPAAESEPPEPKEEAPAPEVKSEGKAEGKKK